MDYKLIEQQLDELNLDGYKHIKNNEWEIPENLFNWLEKHNFEMIGEGAFSSVFQSDTENFVVKINNGYIDEGYLEFVGFCQQNKSNPHLPKMGKPKIIENDNTKFYVLFIEKLSTFNASYYGSNFIKNVDYFFDNAIEYFKKENDSDDRKEYVDSLIFKYEFDQNEILEIINQLYDCVDIMAKFSLNSGLNDFDIHNENIMLRNQTLVITDPVV